MKSIHIASAAVIATGAALGAVALLSTSDRVLGHGYEQALTSAGGATHSALVAAAHAPGSEHSWLTSNAAELQPTLAVAPEHAATGSVIALADIKQAIAAAAGTGEADAMDLLSVQEIARAAVGHAPPTGRSLLVAARIAANDHQPARIVRFVLDVGTANAPARAL